MEMVINEGLEIVPMIESFGVINYRHDFHKEGAYCLGYKKGPVKSLHEEQRAQALSLRGAVDGQPAEMDGRNRISGKPPSQVLGHSVNLEAPAAQREVTANA